MSERIKTVDAVYRETEDEQLRGNPFAEALPPLPDKDEIFRRFQNTVKVPEGLRKKDAIERLKMLRLVEEFRFPFDTQVKVAYDIIPLIENSYLGRNPLKRDDLKLCRKMEKKGLNSQNYREAVKMEEEEEFFQHIRDTKLILGVSGMGKTTAVESILRLYPQVIRHADYRGEKFMRDQIVYLKVECPHSGKQKDFADNILRAFDEALGQGDAFMKLYGGMKPEKKFPAIGNLNELYGVGVYFIDEVQHLAERKEGKVLSGLITSIMNAWKVPFIFVGTPLVRDLYTKCLRETRRLGSEGVVTIDRLERDSAEWKTLIKTLWTCQLTKTVTPYKEKFADVFYDYTQGILALAIKLFKRVQAHVILDPLNEDERITKDAIEETFNEEFQTVRPIISAIQRGDKTAMRSFGDVLIDLDKSFEESDRYVAENGAGSYDKSQRENKRKAIKKDIRAFLKSDVKGLRKKEIKKIAEKILRENAEELDSPKLLIAKSYVEAKKLLEKKKNRPKKKKKKAAPKSAIHSVNLRKVEEKKSAYVLLRADGHIAGREEAYEWVAS